MAFLVEGPWTILFIGIVVEAILGVILMQTGRGKFLIAMIGVAVVVGALLIVERLVVTDREAVTSTLDAAVAAVKKNDVNGLLDCIAPSAESPRELSRWVLKRCEVEEAHISDLEIKVNRLTSPPSAAAKFLAVGKGKDRMGEVPYQAFGQKVEVQLELRGGRWLVTGYKLLDFDLKHL
jgi:hypothetical protein